MKAEVEQPDGSYRIEERGGPKCGKDFCDSCGDCLNCYFGDPCVHNKSGKHRWVIYQPIPREPSTPTPTVKGEK